MNALMTTILALMLGQATGGTTGMVTGQLLHRDGTPAAGVRIGAVTAGSSDIPLPGVSLAVTDESGRYQITLPPGPYYIQAGRVVGPTYYPGTATRAEAGVVRIAAGSAATIPTFRLLHPWEATVSGRVTGGSPAELAGATVQLLSMPGGPQMLSPQTLSTSLMSDGTFEFQRVVPGMPYLAMIRIPNPKSIATVPVNVAADDVSEVALPLLRIREVHGSVTVDGGGLVPEGMQINSGPMTDFSGDQDQIMADSMQRSTMGRRNLRLTGESTFFLNLAEGAHKISVSRLPEGFTVQSIRYGSIDLLKEPLRWTTAQASNEIRVILAPK
jgi:hypothetical protein